MTIILAADHAGFELKQKISLWLSKKGYAIVDVGADRMINSDHYPLYAEMGAQAVKHTKGALGIFICGSGIGMSIVANRHRGIRAAVAESVSVAKRARAEDDANVLALGSRIISFEKAKKIISAWLGTKFSSAKRHHTRVVMIDNR